ncbi:hypothetical protein [Aureibacter tunicatorum]|uniref:Uncharacterized protein n=1 Tax=Aureibacter tunicatorum TaxID=866807 RepID=A0AAE3XJR7_9BACT|nr:hypothetical protein [Aureibacter tunicatorum]MDR6237918.1 hypothetical protein [Aureibacter tunicatorum]
MTSSNHLIQFIDELQSENIECCEEKEAEKEQDEKKQFDFLLTEAQKELGDDCKINWNHSQPQSMWKNPHFDLQTPPPQLVYFL